MEAHRHIDSLVYQAHGAILTVLSILSFHRLTCEVHILAPKTWPDVTDTELKRLSF